jgi:hypothetical protein
MYVLHNLWMILCTIYRAKYIIWTICHHGIHKSHWDIDGHKYGYKYMYEGVLFWLFTTFLFRFKKMNSRLTMGIEETFELITCDSHSQWMSFIPYVFVLLYLRSSHREISLNRTLVEC